MVDDGWDLVVWADGEEPLSELIAFSDINPPHVIGDFALLQHDGHLPPIGRWRGVQFNHAVPHQVFARVTHVSRRGARGRAHAAGRCSRVQRASRKWSLEWQAGPAR